MAKAWQNNEELISVAQESTYKAIAWIYDVLDDLLIDGKFDECDSFLKNAPIEQLPPEVVIGYLTISFHAEENLPSYQVIIDRTRNVLKLKGFSDRRIDNVLRGFEKKSVGL